MKKSKIIPLAGMALAVCSLATIPQQSLAITNDIVAQEDSLASRWGDFFGQYGEIGVIRSITINGVENPLFCEFLDPVSALTNFKTGREILPAGSLFLAAIFFLCEQKA